MAILLNGLTIDGTSGEIIGIPDNGRDSARYAWSDEDLAYHVPAYAAAFNGGRPVQNLIPTSEDFEDSSWAATKITITLTPGVTDPNGGTRATTATADGANSRIGWGSAAGDPGHTQVNSIWIKRRTGTGAIQIYDSSGFVTVPVDSTWQRFSTSKVIPAHNKYYISVQIATSGDEVDIAFAQVEDSTGRVYPTIPSEYSPTSTAKDGTEIFPDVEMDSTDWIDYATPTTNELSTTQVYAGTYSRHLVCDASNEGCRNSVLYQVVSGVDYVVDAWVYVVSGQVISAGYAGRLSASSGPTVSTGVWENLTVVVTATATGPEGIRFLSSGGAAEFYVGYCSIKETTTGYAVYGTENGNSVTSNVVTEGVGAALSPVPRLSDNPALTNRQTYSNDQSNAIYTATNVTVGAQDEDGLDGKPNGSCTLTATAANGTVIANAVTAASANQVTRWFLKRKTGTGTIEITADNGGTWTDVTSGITTAFSEVLAEKAAVTNPQIGVRIATSADAVIVGNAELHTDTNLENVRGCGPIFTTTTAVSTTADDYSYDIANHSDTELTYACEWTPGYSASEATGDQEIITLGTAPDMLYHDATNGNIESTDGTNTSTKAETITAGTTYDLEVAYSTDGDSLQVSVDGTGGSDVAYDDAFPTGTQISLFRNSSFAQEMFAFTITITAPDGTSIPVFAHHYMNNIG